MSTATIAKPIIMEFELDTSKNFKEVRHFNLIDGKDLFTEKLNISINRGFSKAKYTYSVKVWQGKKWSEQITGLYATEEKDIYYGDTINKTHLLLVKFIDNSTKLRLYHFENFYTRRIKEFLQIFKQHY